MTAALAAMAVLGLLVAPHRVSFDGAPPMLAAVVWLSALVLRASVIALAAVTTVAVLPSTEVFRALTHWCWHAVLPLVATHLGLDGHAFGDVALVIPVLVLGASALSVGVGLWRAARAVRRLVGASISGGPRDSVIVGDQSILIAAAGLRRPRVVVSAGALTTLDDPELYAGLDHEVGHIHRRHRWLLLAGEACRALARPLPGTTTAARELAFHLERDADRYALECRHDPLDLVQAICKAAEGASPVLPMTGLNGGTATRRVRELLDPPAPCSSLTGLRALATALVVLSLGLLATLPPATVAAVGSQAAPASRACPS